VLDPFLPITCDRWGGLPGHRAGVDRHSLAPTCRARPGPNLPVGDISLSLRGKYRSTLDPPEGD
jgi:hypothetical protein